MELAAVAAVAISQPILDVFGRAPEVFIEADATGRDVWVFALVVGLLPALAVGVLLGGAHMLSGSLGARRMASAIACALFAIFGTQIARHLTDADAAVIAFAVTVSACGLLAWLRSRWIHTWLRFLGVAPLLFPAVFIMGSPSGDLARASSSAPSVDLAPGQRGPVVVLVLDELPTASLLDADGNVDAERYPGFARLAAESTWFRNATSISSNTLYAVPAIFTGAYPEGRAVSPDASQHPDNLFRLFGGEYRLNVTEYVTRLCALERCDPDNAANAPAEAFATDLRPSERTRPIDTLLGDAWSTFVAQVRGNDPSLNPTAMDIDEEFVVPDIEATSDAGSGTDKVANTAQPARFAEWLARIDGDSESPQLSVLHSVIPHHPWRLDATGTAYRSFGGASVAFSKFDWLDRRGAVTTMRQRHLEMVRYADTLIAALIDRLETVGVWDDATVVVTADHGASFAPGAPFRSWTAETQVDVIGVPLFVHGPTFDGGSVDDTPAQLVDIVPTIAAAQSIEMPWAVDGVDLATAGTARTTHPYAVKGFPNEAVKRPYDVIEIDVGEHLTDLLATRPSRAFGSDALATWRTGPQPDLLGRAIDDMRVGPPSDITFRPVPNSLATASGVGDDEGIHALAVGKLDGPISAGDTMAITVDGVIVSTGTVDDVDGQAWLSAFVAPTLVRDAGATVAYYIVDSNDPLTVRMVDVAEPTH